MSNLLIVYLLQAFKPPVAKSKDVITCGNIEDQLLYEVARKGCYE